MKAQADWSLARRTAWQFSLVATAFLALVALGATVAYRWILHAELDEELTEQLEEVRGRYGAGPGGRVEWERLVVPTGREQAETPMAWRMLDTQGTTRWGPYGATDLQAHLQGTLPLDQTVRLQGVLRRRWETWPTGPDGAAGVVDVVLDGSDWIDRIRLFELAAAVVVLLGGTLSLAAGRVFGSRVGLLLERTAGEIEKREERRGSGAERIVLADAPREIRAVAEAVERTLEATREETERARLLSAGLAHDLRAPVQALLTSIQVALLEPPNEPRALLQDHLDELRVLARTIDNLVAWGSPQVQTGARVRFDLRHELDARLRAEEEAAARLGVFLDVEGEGNLELDGDPVLLVLAVRNLVSNAIAWSPTGGQVRVALLGESDRVRIEVTDEGPGVLPEEREAIFEPFVRGEAAPGRRSGYGLGLAIVDRAVKRHGGTVQVAEGPSGGARFALSLPRLGST